MTAALGEAASPASAWFLRHGRAMALLAVAIVYAPSLGGSWVWDDVYQYAQNPAMHEPWVLLTRDVWEPTGHKNPDNTPIYRPLAMLSHSPGQMWIGGPFIERALNLALHLGVVALAGALALALGASARSAWLMAALFGVHPAVTEAVAWISSRGDLMGSALVVGAALALARGREGRAGVLLALAPFCKEPFLFVPASVAIWAIGARRVPWRTLAGALGGALAYLGLRSALEIPLPVDSPLDGAGAALGAIGAVAQRSFELLLIPTAPDALAPFAGNAGVGLLAILLCLPLFGLAWGRPWLALGLGALPLLAPAAPASLANGLLADRYFYVAFALVTAAAASALTPLFERRTPLALAALLALVLAPTASLRAYEWTSNERLFRAALERHPANAEAQYQVAFDLHTRAGDCEAAVPLYRQAMRESARAANNLLACWLALGQLDNVIRDGPYVARRVPGNPNPAANTARAFLLRGEPAEAESWVREALRRAAPSAGRLVLLGNALGMQGHHDEALAAFSAALEIDPGSAEAQQGSQVALRFGARGALAPATPARERDS